MAKKQLTDLIIKLYSKLGGNVGEVLGSRSNVSFLGVGKSPEGFIDSTLNIEAVGSLGKSKVLDELKSSMGYLTANKLNDVQKGKLYENMLRLDEFYNPQQIPNITDMGTGTRDLTQEGLGALRATRKTDDDLRILKEEVDLPEGVDPRETILPTSGLMGRIEGQMEKIKKASNRLTELEAEKAAMYKPKPIDELQNYTKSKEDIVQDLVDRKFGKGYFDTVDDIPPVKGSNEITSLETMVQNKAGNEFITGFVDDLYKNSGAVSSVDVPKKRAAARMFLNSMLKKETDLLPPGKGGTLESVITEADYKYVTEGGGGVLGDPLVLVKKYFGNEVAKRIPLDTRTEVIDTFVDNVRFTKDKAGFSTDDPRFNPDDLPEFKHGGLAKILEV